MNEQQVRQIIQDELRKNQGRTRFGLQQTQLHAHTGNDGTPQIKAENIVPSLSASGSIRMRAEDIYTLQFDASFTPRSVFATGNVQVIGGAAERYMFVGTAQLGPSFYFQPKNSRTVVTGGPQYPFRDPNNPQYGSNVPMQSCSYWGSESNGGARHTLVGNFHIIDIQYPEGTSHARATIIDFSKGSITIAVETLDTNWEINANFVVS